MSGPFAYSAGFPDRQVVDVFFLDGSCGRQPIFLDVLLPRGAEKSPPSPNSSQEPPMARPKEQTAKQRERALAAYANDLAHQLTAYRLLAVEAKAIVEKERLLGMIEREESDVILRLSRLA